MINLKLKKRILSILVSSLVMCGFVTNVNVSAVETNRSYRHGLGDVTEDESLKSNDMLILQKYLLGQIDFSSSQLKTANMQFSCKDGATVNSADLYLMKKCLLNTCGYPESSIDGLHSAISNSGNIVLQNMRDVVGEFLYEYSRKGFSYEQKTSLNYTINGQTFTDCRTDCSTAVCLALYMSGVLDETAVSRNFGGIKYLDTASMVNGFSTLKNCVNSSYSISLINLIPNSTFIYPGDILVYPSGHTSVVVSTATYGFPDSLSANNSANVIVYGAGGDFAEVHRHRLIPEMETIDLSASGDDQGLRPYTHIIRVTRK